MTDLTPRSAAQSANPPLLYSQVEPDERGNFEYPGDLKRNGRDLPALTAAIHQHLESRIAGGRFSVRGERFAGGRKVIVEVLDVAEELTSVEVRRSFEVAVRDQIERFGFVRSNVLQDQKSCSFSARSGSVVPIGRRSRHGEAPATR